MVGREMKADELEEHLKFTMFNEVSYCKDFIRQQQAEIDNLTSIKYVNGVTISKLYAEIEALKKECDRLYRIIELNGTLK